MGASKEGRMRIGEKIDLVLRETSSLLQDTQTPPGGEGDGSIFVPMRLLSSVGVNNGAPKGGGGKEDSNSSHSRESPISSISSEELGEDKDPTLELRRLLNDHLRLITVLNKRLSRAELTAEVGGRERDQLQATLESERLERKELLLRNQVLEDQRAKHQVIIEEKDEKIHELEARLASVPSPKLVTNQGTRMTPLPVSEELRYEDEDGNPFPIKRRKLDTGGSQTTPTSSKRSSESRTFTTLPQTYHHGKFLMRNSRSDSPPQLSPAVGLRSTAPNFRFRGSGSRELPKYLPRDRVDDQMSEYPPDEFQDELDRISFLSQQNIGKGARSQIGPSRLLPSGSSAFSRPLPRPRQVTRVMMPENRRRFSSHAPLRSSMQQFRQSLQHSYSATTLHSLAPKNSTSSSDLSNPALSREPPQLLSIRNNNFLKMSRPIARRPPTAPFTPSSSQHSQAGTMSENSSPQSLSRSLESSTSEAAKANDERISTPEAPPVVQKRRPGRPLGFRPKKREPKPISSPLSTSSVGPTPTDTRLSNGVRDDLLSKSEPPPPRFSKRGRLLKPNRARYSPDPDNSMHSSSREKFMTTKKNYYVSEPFVPEGYGGSLDETLNSDTLLGPEDSLSRKGVEEEELLCPPARTNEQEVSEGEGSREGGKGVAAIVEVPQWRIISDETFWEDLEGRTTPDDDMSEEAFVKRHQKPEVQEKQRKRWDMQMLREESYKEKMQRKQAERERQKELRRQQRKRKGRAGATEEEVVNPSAEDIKAVYVGHELPVGAFGQTLPINEKVDFDFSIGCASPLTALPSPKPVSTATLDNANANTDVISSSNVKESQSCSSSEVTVVVNIDDEVVVSDRLESGETELPAIEGSIISESSATPPQPPLPSPTSSSSLSFPSIPSPAPHSSTPPPPIIFCMRDNDKVKDVYEYTEDDDNLLAPSLVTTFPISDRAKIASHKEKEIESESPSISVDECSTSVNIIINDEISKSSSITNSPKIRPCVTIPLSVPIIKGRGVGGSSSCGSKAILSNQSENLAIPVSSSNAQSANIQFFIPSNPLARPRMSSVPTSCSASSSVKMSDDEHSSKDKDLQS